MISFESDYITGAHPKILEALIRTNLEPQPGYGADAYTESARKKILTACRCPNGDVHFLTGGTQTNATVIAAMLKPYEGVLSASTGHINAHESGAVEYTGHKVLSIPHKNGKLPADALTAYLKKFYGDESCEHMVYPGMVYISHPTEYGTLYSLAELEVLSEICHQYDLTLFMDGARLGFGLMTYDTDVTLADIARLCDVFYIGGTKMGALCGEAVVFTKNNTPKHFTNIVKKHGALLAKGRLTSIQFDTLFTDDLYFEIGRHGIDMAQKLKAIFADKGYRFFVDSPTNQQFVILPNEQMERMKEKVAFSFWEEYDACHTVVRFATGWSTTEDDLTYLESLL